MGMRLGFGVQDLGAARCSDASEDFMCLGDLFWGVPIKKT